MGNGSCVKINLASVRGSSAKTITYLNSLLPKSHERPLTVVFLGESHESEVDRAVTQAMLLHPPLAAANHTRVIFERGLQNRHNYVTGTAINHVEDERSDVTKTIAARNSIIGDLVIRAVDPALANDSVIYIACGSEHAQPIFDYLDAKMTRKFTYLLKPSDDDK